MLNRERIVKHQAREITGTSARFLDSGVRRPGIEPTTSCTRNGLSTTELSRQKRLYVLPKNPNAYWEKWYPQCSFFLFVSFQFLRLFRPIPGKTAPSWWGGSLGGGHIVGRHEICLCGFRISQDICIQLK